MSFPRANIQGLAYVSLYFHEFERAVGFYTAVFGEPDVVVDKPVIRGWKLGNTHLTLFPSQIGPEPTRNPCNTEFAIRVTTAKDVDRLTAVLEQHGAKAVMAPEDTEMYEPMRFAAVDDPFGVRIDVYFPLDCNPKS